jgi:hypothetical protein
MASRTQVLIEIRDEVRRTNERLGQTNERLSGLERRQTETEVRLATELVAVARAVNDVRDLLRAVRVVHGHAPGLPRHRTVTKLFPARRHGGRDAC